MTDLEIYDLAIKIISDLSNGLQAGLYSEWKGNLNIYWSQEKSFNASASSHAPVSNPPDHSITLNYELALRIYRDAEEYCNFVNNQDSQQCLVEFFRPLKNAKFETALPTCFTHDDCVRNMFIASLTWVFFHEVGHLVQEHGFSKSQLSGIEVSETEIQEFDASSSRKLGGKEAAISHTLELAADYEAINLCIAEIVRHIKDDNWMNGDAAAETYSGLIYLLSSGLACLFYRFGNAISTIDHYAPEGNHPPPILRLEIALSHIYEMNDNPEMRKISGHELDRKELVGLCVGAVCSGAIFWSLKSTGKPIQPDLLIKGILNRPEARKYLRMIIETWDELLPLIVKNHRLHIPAPFLLTFTDVVRTYVIESK